MYTLILWILSCQADVCVIAEKQSTRYPDRPSCLAALAEWEKLSQELYIGICVKDD